MPLAFSTSISVAFVVVAVDVPATSVASSFRCRCRLHDRSRCSRRGVPSRRGRRSRRCPASPSCPSSLSFPFPPRLSFSLSSLLRPSSAVLSKVPLLQLSLFCLMTSKHVLLSFRIHPFLSPQSFPESDAGFCGANSTLRFAFGFGGEGFY